MRVSLSMMAHRCRERQVAHLLARLDADPMDIPVAWDEQMPPRRDHDRVWRNCRAAWELRDPDADWHVVLQDDAVPCADLLAGLRYALPVVGDRAVVSLYLGAGAPLPRMWGQLAARADAEDAAWVIGPRTTWGVGIAVRTEAVPDMLDAGDRQGGVPDDQRIARWASRRRLEAWFPWPSLVDHAEGASLVGHPMVRQARRWQGGSALHDWDPKGHIVHHFR